MLKNIKKKGGSIHGYGASTKGNVLLQFFNIGKETIDCIADRNPLKSGCYTPGTKIKIYDGNKNGALIIDMTVDIMVGDDKISQYQLKISARSNGGEQNTIEISKAKKL